MPSKPKYPYDIDEIARIENECGSMRETARRLGFPEDSTQSWVKRNYKKVIIYVRK